MTTTEGNQAKPAQVRWRVGWVVRSSCGVAVLILLAVAIAETVINGWAGLALVAFAGVFGVVFWRQALVPYVELTPDAVVVQNPYRRQSLAYADIKSVEVTRTSRFPIRITLRSGDVVAPWCVQRSGVVGATRYLVAEEVVAAIRARLGKRRKRS